MPADTSPGAGAELAGGCEGGPAGGLIALWVEVGRAEAWNDRAVREQSCCCNQKYEVRGAGLEPCRRMVIFTSYDARFGAWTGTQHSSACTPVQSAGSWRNGTG